MRIGIIAGSIALSLALAATTGAAPLSKSQIPETAKWVVHLDVEQFAPSQTCGFLTGGNSGAKSFGAMLNHYRTLLGVDPLKDVSSVTLYGSELSGTRGTALVGGALNHRAITQRFSTYPRYAVRTRGKLTLQTWLDKSTGRPLWACFHTTRMLILASDEASLLAGAAILDGTLPSLATTKTAALQIPAGRGGVFFTVVTKGYAGTDADPIKSMILRNTTDAVIQLSERQGNVDGSLVFKAVSPDSAIQIHQILNGLIVSASLADSSSPYAKLADMSEISRNDTTIVLKLHCPAAEAAGLLAATMPAP